jgi:uncharacterized membrane protein
MVLKGKPAALFLLAAINRIGKNVLHNLVHEITIGVVGHIISKLINIRIKKCKLVNLC